MINITEQEALQMLARLENLPYRNVHDIMDLLKSRIIEARGGIGAQSQDGQLPEAAPVPN